MYIKQKLLHPNAKLMQRHPGSVGYDLFAIDSGTLEPQQRERIPLGFATEFTPGYIGLLLDRSSMGNKGVTKFAGVIDPNYRGEWSVILYNSDLDLPFSWKVGDKLVQVVFTKIEEVDPELVEELTESNRGAGAFGSTNL